MGVETGMATQVGVVEGERLSPPALFERRSIYSTRAPSLCARTKPPVKAVIKALPLRLPKASS